MAKIIFEICYVASSTDIFHVSYASKTPITIKDAFDMLKIDDYVPHLYEANIGVFSKKVNIDYSIKNGDRIEIYRPLKISPMDARLLRAKK